MNPNGMSGTVHIHVCTGGIGHQEVMFHMPLYQAVQCHRAKEPDSRLACKVSRYDFRVLGG